jgi:hypothetical protein
MPILMYNILLFYGYMMKLNIFDLYNVHVNIIPY